MLMGYDHRVEPASAPARANASIPTAEPAAPPQPQHHGGGLFDSIAHVAASGLVEVEQLGANAAGRLDHGVNEQHGPSLDSFWNHPFGGPNQQAGDGRPLTQNHIGTKTPGPIEENGTISNLMRHVPYFGDYWESLAVTHDSAGVHNPILNALTAVTDVALPGPVMGLLDAPFRATGTSLFLDQSSLANK